MKFEYGGKVYNVPDQEVRSSMQILGLSKEESCKLWLEDEGILENEEQEALEARAKENKITSKIHGAASQKPRKKKEVVKKEDKIKSSLYTSILQMLENIPEVCNIEIVTQNKLVRFSYQDEMFDIDLIRKNKNKMKGKK